MKTSPMKLLLRIPHLTLPCWGQWFRPRKPLRVDPTIDRLREYLLQKDALNEHDSPRERLDRLARVSKLKGLS